MTYGTIKVDTVIFTDAGVDKSVTLSGLVQNPTFSGNVTVTGTLSGVTVTGTTANFTSGNFTNISGGTLLGVTVTGTTANFTSGNFTNISGGTHTITSGVFAAGSAASPSITFTGDLNTGIYSPGADQVAISTSSSERIRIGANGEIGLGGANYGTNGQVLTSAGSGAAPTWQTLSVSANSITQGNTSAEVIDTGSDGRFVVTTEGSERLRIDSSGRVGIGTTSPGELLHVYNSAATSRLIVGPSGTGAATPNALALEQENTGYTVCHVRNLYNNAGLGELRLGGYGFTTFTSGSSQTERARIDSSGRLLVGTSSARENFYNSTGTAQLQVEGITQSSSSISVTYNNNGVGGPVVTLNKSRSASVGGNTIVSSGDALGNIYFQGNDGTEFVEAALIRAEVDGTPGANDMPGRLVFFTTASGAASPTERMRLNNAGWLSCQAAYDVTTGTSPNLVVGNTGIFQRSTSSAKYKTQIEDAELSYSEALLNCRPVWYRSTCKVDCPDHSYWGFIAEEVAQIDPRLVFWKTVSVSHDEKGQKVETPCTPEPEGVAYDRFVPHLLNLIKRQQQAIEILEAKVAALESA